ncbi:MAPEG family protein [Mesorhizobium sp. M1406]|uniref:MAPEG family protein n=1 Tax=Mesorhizobium sp. M1406 TaxID=2957099 RepID=UPI003335884E
MTFELAMLAGGCALGLFHIVLASHSASLQRSYRWTASARDAPQSPLTGVAGRLSRASANFGETFPLFIAAVVLAHLANAHDGRTIWGSALYLGARIVYLPLYAAGICLVRSLVWNIAVAGIALLIWAAALP